MSFATKGQRRRLAGGSIEVFDGTSWRTGWEPEYMNPPPRAIPSIDISERRRDANKRIVALWRASGR